MWPFLEFVLLEVLVRLLFRRRICKEIGTLQRHEQKSKRVRLSYYIMERFPVAHPCFLTKSMKKTFQLSS